jgi:hypothetical protein
MARMRLSMGATLANWSCAIATKANMVRMDNISVLFFAMVFKKCIGVLVV